MTRLCYGGSNRFWFTFGGSEISATSWVQSRSSGTCRTPGSLPHVEATIYRLTSVAAVLRCCCCCCHHGDWAISRRRGRLVVTFDDPIARQSSILTFVSIVKTIHLLNSSNDSARQCEVTSVTSLECSISMISLICHATPHFSVIDTVLSTALMSDYIFVNCVVGTAEIDHRLVDIAAVFRIGITSS